MELVSMRPDLPGLAIRLDKSRLRELGLPLLQAGTRCDAVFRAIVVHSSTSDPDADGHAEDKRVVLQITELDVEPEEIEEPAPEPEAAETRRARIAAGMYGRK